MDQAEFQRQAVRLLRPTVKRSDKWPAVREAYIKDHPTCENCGGSEKLIVHHKLPVHLFPERELDLTNLKTLCESKTINCHLWHGHLGSFFSYAKDVDQDSAAFLEKVKTRP